MNSIENPQLSGVGEPFYECDLTAERDRLREINGELLTALTVLCASLQWEEKRSGTTYHGYEDALAAIARAKGA